MEKSYRIIAISIHASEKEATLSPLIHLCRYIISIHASEKEATYNNSNKSLYLQFQSTPPRRRRPRPVAGGELRCQFQSTPPRRRRHESCDWKHDIQNISIHASEKEATLNNIENTKAEYDFNPRLREGGDATSGFVTVET